MISRPKKHVLLALGSTENVCLSALEIRVGAGLVQEITIGAGNHSGHTDKDSVTEGRVILGLEITLAKRSMSSRPQKHVLLALGSTENILYRSWKSVSVLDCPKKSRLVLEITLIKRTRIP